jgi:hypothetical protein
MVLRWRSVSFFGAFKNNSCSRKAYLLMMVPTLNVELGTIRPSLSVPVAAPIWLLLGTLASRCVLVRFLACDFSTASCSKADSASSTLLRGQWHFFFFFFFFFFFAIPGTSCAKSSQGHHFACGAQHGVCQLTCILQSQWRRLQVH